MEFQIFIDAKSANYLRLNFLTASTRQDAVSCNTWTTPRPNQSPIEPPTWKIQFTDASKYSADSHLRESRLTLVSSFQWLWLWLWRRRRCQSRCLRSGTCSGTLSACESSGRVEDNPILDFHPRAPPKLCLHIKSVNFTGYSHWVLPLTMFLWNETKLFLPIVPFSSTTCVDTSEKFSAIQTGVMISGICFLIKASSHWA